MCVAGNIFGKIYIKAVRDKTITVRDTFFKICSPRSGERQVSE